MPPAAAALSCSGAALGGFPTISVPEFRHSLRGRRTMTSWCGSTELLAATPLGVGEPGDPGDGWVRVADGRKYDRRCQGRARRYATPWEHRLCRWGA